MDWMLLPTLFSSAIGYSHCIIFLDAMGYVYDYYHLSQCNERTLRLINFTLSRNFQIP